MTKIPNWDGSKVGKADIDDAGLGDIVKKKLLRTAVLAYEANKRQGTVKTKTRGETSYTTRKPFRQKGTGNARRGDFNGAPPRWQRGKLGRRRLVHGYEAAWDLPDLQRWG